MTTRKAPPRRPENNDGSSYLYISLVSALPLRFLLSALRARTLGRVLHNFCPRVLRVFTRGPHTCVTRHPCSRRIWIIGSVPCEFLSVSKEVDTYPARTASTT